MELNQHTPLGPFLCIISRQRPPNDTGINLFSYEPQPQGLMSEYNSWDAAYRTGKMAAGVEGSREGSKEVG